MSRNVEKLQCYRDAIELAVDVIPHCTTIRPYRIGEQIAASALSISSNLAEGAAYETDKDFKRFISYALGSAAELSSQLLILQKINPAQIELEKWRAQSIRLQKMLAALRRTIQKSCE